MSDVFQEVDEGLREDKWRRLALRWAPYAAALVVSTIAIFAGFEIYKTMEENRAQRALAAYNELSNAIDAQQWDAARTHAEAVRATGHKGYSGLASQLEAEAALQAGSPQAAIDALQSAADVMPLGPLSDLARLKAAYLAIDEENLPLAKELAQDLAETSDAFGAHGRELLAAIAFEEGEFAAARNAYESLRLAPTTPAAVNRRAQEALALIAASAPAEAASSDDATAPTEE